MGGVDCNDQLRGYYNTVNVTSASSDFSLMLLLQMQRVFILGHIQTVKSFGVELAKQLTITAERGQDELALQLQQRSFAKAISPQCSSDHVHRGHYCSMYRKECRATVWFCRLQSISLQQWHRAGLLLSLPHTPRSYLWGVIPHIVWYHLPQPSLHLYCDIFYIQVILWITIVHNTHHCTLSVMLVKTSSRHKTAIQKGFRATVTTKWIQ